MKKLTAILVLGMFMYSCTENEKPDQLNLENKISNSISMELGGKDIKQIPSHRPVGTSENAMILAHFTPIDDVSGTYLTETNLIDISAFSCGEQLSSVTDGTLTLEFDNDMKKREVGSCVWTVWDIYPNVESSTPHMLFSNSQNSVGISLSTPVTTFGFELLTNQFFGPFTIQVEFFSGVNLIGNVTREIFSDPAVGGARLFAAKTNASFDYILIQAIDPSSGFGFGQFRYEEGNPFTVDVKPDSCENSVNVNSKGVIPVGILASLDFDVNDIDLSTVRLNGVAPQMSSMADLGGFYEKDEACDCYPEDFDGIMDLDLKFNTQEIVATLGGVADGDQVVVSLSFDTNDGESWTGEDCIWIIKKK
jgi:hypothetical protein